MKHVSKYLVLFIVLFMTLKNFQIFCRYKHCKLDWPYVFVLLAYNIDYLVNAAMAAMLLIRNVVTLEIENLIIFLIVGYIPAFAVFISLCFFTAELHRVKHIVISDNLE